MISVESEYCVDKVCEDRVGCVDKVCDERVC